MHRVTSRSPPSARSPSRPTTRPRPAGFSRAMAGGGGKWDLWTGECLAETDFYPERTETIQKALERVEDARTITISPDGTLLVGVDRTGNPTVLELASGKWICAFHDH